MFQNMRRLKMMSVNDKLLMIQKDLNAPKSQYNSFGNYSFRSCEDITEAVKPLLEREGLVLSMSDEIKQIGNRYYIEATASVIDVVEGDRIDVKAYAREQENKKGMDMAQITGAASSYARKYALNGLFAIDDNKDPDSTNKHGKGKNKDGNSKKDKKNKQSKKTITESTLAKINEWIDVANDKAGEAYSKKQVKSQLYKDFAENQGWKKFFINENSTSEKMAKEFLSYLKERLG